MNTATKHEKNSAGLWWRLAIAFLIAFFLTLIILFSLMPWMWQGGNFRLDAGEASYRKGMAATTVAERQQAFNQALTVLLQMEQKNQPSMGDGRLYAAIGDVYAQLGQDPLAILYYLRAQRLMPRNERLGMQLLEVRQRLSLAPLPTYTAADLFLLRPFLSLPERLQLFFVLAILTIVFFLVGRWARSVFFVIGSLAALLLVSLGAEHYLSPVQGVLVHAAELRSGPGERYLYVKNSLLPGGSVVDIDGVRASGEWLLIAEGKVIGYVPADGVRLF